MPPDLTAGAFGKLFAQLADASRRDENAGIVAGSDSATGNVTATLNAKYQHFLAGVLSSQAVSLRVFELCLLRTRQIHGVGIVADDFPAVLASEIDALAQQELDHFSANERSALIVAEKMPYQHHEVSDADVTSLKSEFGEAGCVSLLTALAFFDVACRLDATMESYCQ